MILDSIYIYISDDIGLNVCIICIYICIYIHKYIHIPQYLSLCIHRSPVIYSIYKYWVG